MYKYSKLTFKVFIITVVAIWLYLPVSTYIYDPLQVWHKPYFRDITYVENSREAVKAIVMNNEFDSVIIGNSLATNTSSKEAGKKLNSNCINLSMDGAMMPENKIILNFVLRQKQIKKVIYILGVHYLDLREENENFPQSKYKFLFDKNKFNDYKIYLNDRYSECILTLSTKSKCIGNKLNMDKPYAWDSVEDHIKRLGGFDKWIKHKDNAQIKEAMEYILESQNKAELQSVSKKDSDKIYNFLYKNFFSVVEQNPNTEFYLVLPPVSTLELAREIRVNDTLNFNRQKVALKYMMIQGDKYKNLKIFAFDDVQSVGSIEKYKDLIHYSPAINSYMLDAIKSGKHIINSKNIDKYINRVYKKASSYNYQYYYNKIKNVLNSD